MLAKQNHLFRRQLPSLVVSCSPGKAHAACLAFNMVSPGRLRTGEKNEHPCIGRLKEVCNLSKMAISAFGRKEAPLLFGEQRCLLLAKRVVSAYWREDRVIMFVHNYSMYVEKRTSCGALCVPRRKRHKKIIKYSLFFFGKPLPT